MGTTPQGKRPNNDITISRSGTAKSVDPLTGKSTIAGPGTADAIEAARQAAQPERSFAQPSPVAPPKVVAPKTHGSEKDQKSALARNSTLKKLPTADEPVDEKVETETETQEGDGV
ncbi:MAG: hypothetical protein JW384_00305 [Nitrosomonadaceae bacterium]|nr:hypothetical protein [Nitrosomonadaceae bacterium]